MHHHSRLRHKWRKLLREQKPMVFLVVAVILVLLLTALTMVLLTDPRFRPRW